MIAAVRRRALVARVRAERLTRQADRRLNALLVGAPRVEAWTRTVDRRANRLLLNLWPLLERLLRHLRRAASWAGHRLRPVAVRVFRLLAWLERRLLRVRDLAIRAATRASAVLTPQRAICATIIASAACLAVAQFVEYRAVEIGQPGYAGLPAATPPTIGGKTAGAAHAYLLLPVALLAAVLAVAAMRNERRRGLGRIIFVLGLLSLAVVLLIDRPAGLDASAQAAQFSGATAVLEDGYYAQIAAAFGLMLGGALLTRARKPSLARTQGGRRSARTLFVRKQGGRPRTRPDEGLQRSGATMRGRA